jgi:hypothetical protein
MLISIDPGYTSGTCIADRGIRSSGSFTVTACIAIEWANRFFYHDFITTHGKAIDAIIVEDFKLTRDPKKLRTQYKSRMPSSQIIGLIDCAAYAAGILDRVIFQEPADKFNVRIPPEDQPIVGLIDHNQDAYRHLRYYVQRTRIII